MKVFMEQDWVAPRQIVLEAWVCSMSRTPATRVEQKQTQKEALKLRGDLMQICLLARPGGQFARQIVAEEVVEMPERLEASSPMIAEPSLVLHKMPGLNT
jgi:hypothetical protein